MQAEAEMLAGISAGVPDMLLAIQRGGAKSLRGSAPGHLTSLLVSRDHLILCMQRV